MKRDICAKSAISRIPPSWLSIESNVPLSVFDLRVMAPDFLFRCTRMRFLSFEYFGLDFCLDFFLHFLLFSLKAMSIGQICNKNLLNKLINNSLLFFFIGGEI